MTAGHTRLLRGDAVPVRVVDLERPAAAPQRPASAAGGRPAGAASAPAGAAPRPFQVTEGEWLVLVPRFSPYGVTIQFQLEREGGNVHRVAGEPQQAPPAHADASASTSSAKSPMESLKRVRAVPGRSAAERR